MVSSLSSAQARNAPVQSCNHQLASFPHLENSDFEKACSTLLDVFELHAYSQTQWTAVDSVSQNDTTFLRITKPLALHQNVADASEINEETELDEEDDEVAVTAVSDLVVIHYDILLSPSYRVPVLYFSISDNRHRYPPTMNTLYTHIIYPEYKAQAENVGVIGGITITDHPAANKPVFFIHPCQTADVMECSANGRNISAYEYLLMWIGALGKCVGLNVPLNLVNAEQRRERTDHPAPSRATGTVANQVSEA
ncbi:autophagy-related protein 10 [Stagonosporopsis vannaccii]|nr:autophagy-related protein 10 [Stagonosporopsis vannaccii]